MWRNDGIDLYELYKYGGIAPADTVHHIEPTSEHQELFWTEDNLIPVSNKSHKEIHRLYKTEKKRETQDFLKDCIFKYKQKAWQ